MIITIMIIMMMIMIINNRHNEYPARGDATPDHAVRLLDEERFGACVLLDASHTHIYIYIYINMYLVFCFLVY